MEHHHHCGHPGTKRQKEEQSTSSVRCEGGGMGRSDWWKELGVRHSASSLYKAADCFSSTDYSNLDLQWAKGACVWLACGWLLCLGGWGVVGEGGGGEGV